MGSLKPRIRKHFRIHAAWAVILAVGLSLSALPARGGAEIQLPSLADLVERLRPSVVNISTETIIKARRRGIPGMPGDPWSEFFRRFFEGNPGMQPPGMRPPGPGMRPPAQKRSSSLGSGLIIDAKGFILTNNHVIDKATEITVVFHDSKRRKATVVGRDPRTDIALLKVELKDGERLPAVKLGDSDKLRVGDWVVAIGNPFGLSHTVTTGIVSAKERIIGAGPYDDFIQTDASINPGNSGGPLFNLKGEVIGINTAIFSRSGGNIGIGFAIPINVASKLLPQLRKGAVTRGYLGVTIQPVNEALAKSFGLKKKGGALVSSLVKKGPAEKSGIQRGDIILSLNGKEVKDNRALARMAADLLPGSSAELGIFRKGKMKTVSLKVGRLPGRDVVASKPSTGKTTEKLGLRLENLTPEIARQVGADTEFGVVISGVTPDSPAGRARLRQGDVIIEVNRKPVHNVEDFQAALKADAKEGNLFLIERRGSTHYIPVEGAG